MKKIVHKSATASHYNKEADTYDLFNEKSSKCINKTIENILSSRKAATILDLTCGTGSQVFYLTEKGYLVTGCDISHKMLKIAKEKMMKKKLNLSFIKGDMRLSKLGSFDAILTIFNSIGHLTKSDFNKTLKNIYRSLNDRGIYIFDIFNLDYLLYRDNITKLTIDWLKKSNNKVSREIQYSTIDARGVLASYDIYFEQKGSDQLKLSNAFQTLQVYNASQLKSLLEMHGFKVIKQCNIDGTRFSKIKSERVLTVAQKIR